MLLLLLNIYSTFPEPKNTLTARVFLPLYGFFGMRNCGISSASSYFAQITPTDFTAWGFVHNDVKKKIIIINPILPHSREGG